MVDDLVDPCEQKMRLEVMALGELGALRRFELLHGLAVATRLLGAKGVDRIDEPVAVILVDLRVGQLPAHVTILYRDPAAVDDQRALPPLILTGPAKIKVEGNRRQLIVHIREVRNPTSVLIHDVTPPVLQTMPQPRVSLQRLKPIVPLP